MGETFGNNKQEKMKRLGGLKVILISIAILYVLLGGCSGNKASLPFGSTEKGNLTFEEAQAQLEDAGFTNITAEAAPTHDKDQEGKLESMKVDGDENFSKGHSEDKDIPIELTYYELEQYEVTMEMSAGGSEGIPVFTISTNLPDDTKLTLTLSDSNGYSKEQTLKIEDGTAVSKEFTTEDITPLPSGDYILTVAMKMSDQGFFAGSKARGLLGSDGECMTGDYVRDEGDTKYIYAEYSYTSTYEEPEPVSKEELLKTIDEAIKMGFGENSEVTMDEYGYTANVWQSGVAMLATFAQTGSSEYLNQWNSLVDSTESAAASVKLVIMSAGYSDMIFVINVMNDQNRENTLLTVVDGTTYYDCVNGIDLLRN